MMVGLDQRRFHSRSNASTSAWPFSEESPDRFLHGHPADVAEIERPP